MSETAGFDSVGAAAEVPAGDNSGGDSNGFNPAWSPLLEKLPDEFHGMIAPTLKEWDQNFQRVQSQFSPYKDFAEQGVDPAQITASMQLAKVIQENPRLVYDKMVEYYGDEWGINNSGQGVVEQGNPVEDASLDGGAEGVPFEVENHPMFQQMQQQMQAMTQFQQAQIEAQQMAQINAELDRDFKAVETKFAGGEQLTQQEVSMIGNIAIAQGITVPKAADIYFGMHPRQSAPPANNLPHIVPPGGGMPSQAINPASLTEKQTRATVAEILRAANERQ